jgi:hypothetical protein
VAPKVEPFEDCPCESGREAQRCCRKPDGRLWRKPPNVLPPLPRTGYSHPFCYMSSTQDCSEDISREHYVSRSVLESMEGPGTVNVSGAPWLKPNETRAVSIDGITAKILCSRHNSALTGLDLEAGRFFRTIRSISVEFSEKTMSRKPKGFLFSGTTLEMWMVKAACGMYFSGNAMKDGKRLVGEHSFDQGKAIPGSSRRGCASR